MARKKAAAVPAVVNCPECGKLVATRFPMHDCKPPIKAFAVGDRVRWNCMQTKETWRGHVAEILSGKLTGKAVLSDPKHARSTVVPLSELEAES